MTRRSFFAALPGLAALGVACIKAKAEPSRPVSLCGTYRPTHTATFGKIEGWKTSGTEGTYSIYSSKWPARFNARIE
jgi:hypothetical protein